MRQTYVDTGGFLALLRPADRDHDRMRAHFVRLREQGDMLVTSEAVVSETVTLLRHAAGMERALAFRDALVRSVRGGGIRILNGDDTLRHQALALMAQHEALPLTYTDCVGAALARQKRVAAIVGVDENFRKMGFALEPE